LLLTDKSANRLSLAILAILIAVFFWTAPRDGSFWWSDTSRHALNGVFVADFIAQHPVHAPVQFATDYYLKYPALTILFYPPLFYVFEAPFFRLFGVSETVALIPVMIFYFALAAGSYFLAKRWLPWSGALAAALLMAAAPEVAFWGRQVMLDIPCMAFVIWSVYWFFRFFDTGRWRSYYFGLFLLTCALYTKMNAVFLAPVILAAVPFFRGKAVLSNKRFWIALAIFIVFLVPLGVLTLKFGQANIESVTGVPDAVAPRWSLAGLTFYLRCLPQQMGRPLAIIALLGVAGQILLPKVRLPRRDAIFMGTWLLSGYIFFSMISLKETRHSLLILYPLLPASIVLLCRLLPRRLAMLASLGLAALVAATTLSARPVPWVRGYQQAANYVADHSPTPAVVLFSGYRDGSFIFNLRARKDRQDIYTVRADKLLLRIAVKRELGVKEISHSEEEIGSMLNTLGVSYVVAQTDFWTDLEVMNRLQHRLRSPQFQEVARIPVKSNVPTSDHELVIYKNLGPFPERQRQITIDLPMIRQQVSGSLPK
jgi:hypothetical protein